MVFCSFDLGGPILIEDDQFLVVHVICGGFEPLDPFETLIKHFRLVVGSVHLGRLDAQGSKVVFQVLDEDRKELLIMLFLIGFTLLRAGRNLLAGTLSVHDQGLFRRIFLLKIRGERHLFFTRIDSGNGSLSFGAEGLSTAEGMRLILSLRWARKPSLLPLSVSPDWE